jgi:two-component system, sensor histidine kinase PdtaS
MATPLSMVLTELLQNALEHGLRGRSGLVEVSTRRLHDEIEIVVADDGEGLPAGFSLSESPRLGLQIVRTLIEGDLRGRIDVRARAEGGTLATVRIPVHGEEDGAHGAR